MRERQSVSYLARAGVLGLVVLSGIGIHRARIRGGAMFTHAKNVSDVYALPPLDALVPASLGYRSALADIVMTFTTIQFGIHAAEGRPFEFVGHYLDSVVELDPKYREPYRLGDALLLFQAGRPKIPEEDLRHARRLMERGMKELPFDERIWGNAGQYLAFLAPSYLSDPEEIKDFKAAGARALAHAGEIAGGRSNVQWQALGAVGVFTKEGHRAAGIAVLRKMVALTEDDDLRATALEKLQALEGEEFAARSRRHSEAFQRIWRDDFPAIPRARLLAIGPSWPVLACAGKPSRDRCARAWSDRAELAEFDPSDISAVNP